MKNYIHGDEAVVVPAPANVTAGQFVAVGAVFGAVENSAASGVPVKIHRRGVFRATTPSASNIAVGAELEFADGAFVALDQGTRRAIALTAAPSGVTVLDVVLV